MNSLQSRKRLLLAESELNRAQMVAEAAALAVDVRGFASRARSFGLAAASANLLVTGLGMLRGDRTGDAGAKPSWLKTIFKSAGVVSSLWLAFRAVGHHKPPHS